MLHRFSNFDIDEARRELRSGDGVVVPQRRVFALLAYLARHSGRVVSKEELLGAVWTGLIVTDNSVQRAVSVARAALRQLACDGEIRTYARQGYRLSAKIAREHEDAQASTDEETARLAPADHRNSHQV